MTVMDSILRCLGVALVGMSVANVVAVAAAPEPPENFVLHDAPKPLPEIRFHDGQGKARSLADFRGKVVLLNIWATWCAPCRREMPTLDRLQATLGGPDFEVVALSIDRAGLDVVRKFYAEVGIGNLAMYIDSSGKAWSKLGVVGLPMTFLIDREGREIGRLVGPAEWDAPEMLGFLRSRLSERSSSLVPGSSGQAMAAIGPGASARRQVAAPSAGRQALTFQSLETPYLTSRKEEHPS